VDSAMDRAELMRRVRAGEYVVDPHAVAGAMLERRHVREALLSSDEVLEAADLERPAARPDERDARSRRGSA
jgi:hypothetical protein